MTSVCDLTDRHCVPCEGGVPTLTREEAENLLNELKSEEGDLNFVPGYQGTTDNSSGRDW